jgi:putative addiction module component (TIGR02574 family)
MTFPALDELLQLSVAERLQLVQDLWDSIAADSDAIPVTEGQRRELARRSRAHRENPAEAAPIEDALARIERTLE